MDDLKYVQTVITRGEPDLEKFSGNGGRSYVTLSSEHIDMWNTADEAIEDGKESFKPKVHWGVFAMDPSNRKIVKCCYDSKR